MNKGKNDYKNVPNEGNLFDEDGLMVYWNFCGDQIQPGEVSNGRVLLEVSEAKGKRIGKWAYTTAKTPEEYATILGGNDKFKQYQLMLLASERDDSGLAKQVLDILGENGVREVLIEATTNPLAPREQREHTCDYLYGFGPNKDYRLPSSLVARLETLAR